jgi:DNA-binding XRE family transcriptional regulator
MTYLAKLIAQKRAESGHTQASLARKVGLRCTAIYEIERRDYQYLHKLPEISAELKIDLDDVFDALVYDYADKIKTILKIEDCNA